MTVVEGSGSAMDSMAVLESSRVNKISELRMASRIVRARAVEL